MRRSSHAPAAPCIGLAAALLGALVLLASSAHSVRAETDWLEPGRAFRPLLADPREVRTSIDWADGGNWSLRAGTPVTILRSQGERATVRFGLDGGAWFWFETDGGFVFPLQTVDGMVGFWVEEERPGGWTWRVRLGHQSAHVGDGADQRTAIIYSREYLGAVAAYQPGNWRVYGGPAAWIRAEPKTKAMQFQVGGDWRSGGGEEGGLRPFVAADLQWRAEWNGRIGQSYQAGLEARGGLGHTFRLAASYFDGMSQRGQEWDTPEKRFMVGISFSE